MAKNYTSHSQYFTYFIETNRNKYVKYIISMYVSVLEFIVYINFSEAFKN